MTLRSIGINEKTYFKEMAEKAASEGLEECLVPLTIEDVVNIYEECY